MKPLLLSVFLTLALGCQSSDRSREGSTSEDQMEERLTTTQGVRLQADAYFPTQLGSRWAYTIETFSPHDPLSFRNLVWPVAEDEHTGEYTVKSWEVMGRLTPRSPFDNTHELVLSVTQTANERQGYRGYPKGVLISIEKDELGIFENCDEVYWAITEQPRLEINEIRMYSRSTFGAPNDKWQGLAERLLLADIPPGKSLGVDGEREVVTFVGRETSDDGTLLHFRRSVMDRKNPIALVRPELDSILQKEFPYAGFDEDMWFAKGKGLVRLEQRVKGTLTMRWILNEQATKRSPSSQ